MVSEVTCLAQGEVVPRVVHPQHRVVVGREGGLRRRALVQRTVLSFPVAEEEIQPKSAPSKDPIQSGFG